MPKPAERIGRSNAGQRLNNRILECFSCASAHPPQNGFQFGKGPSIGEKSGEYEGLNRSWQPFASMACLTRDPR